MTNEPKYYEGVEDIRKKLAYYEAGYAKASGYDKWMYGRRVGEYRGFVYNLTHDIHQIILGTSDSKVCNCALMIPERERSLFWFFDGHRNYDKQPVKAFYYYKYSADQDPQLLLYCQLCQNTSPAEVDEDNRPVTAPKCNCNIEDSAQTFDI
jgi:hypothetical protein